MPNSVVTKKDVRGVVVDTPHVVVILCIRYSTVIQSVVEQKRSRGHVLDGVASTPNKAKYIT